MTKPDRLLTEQELQEAGDRMSAVAENDKDAIERELEYLRELHRTRRLMDRFIADHAPGLVTKALRAGFRPIDLIGRPYTDTRIRALRREAGIRQHRRGPVPRSQSQPA